VAQIHQEMTDKILKHQFLLQTFQKLSGYLHQIEVGLKANEHDIRLNSMKLKVEHDISIIRPMLESLDKEILRDVETESGQKFKFVLNDEPKEPFKKQVSKLMKA
jgi:hypothetical protein